MAPAPITNDYYIVLEVEQTATPELIIGSYKRLALKLHPDRNAKHDITEAFQLVCQFSGAKLILLSIIILSVLRSNIKARTSPRDIKGRKQTPSLRPHSPVHHTRTPSPQNTQTPRPPPASTPQPEALNEAAQIAALQRSKQERGARWRIKKNAFDSSIVELQIGIRHLEQEINNLDSVFAAEAAIEAQKNSWRTWLLSLISKKAEDTEEEKARKDRERQERRIEKDMKERRLVLKKADLKREENLSRKAKEEIDAADLGDDGKIRAIQVRIWARETREKQEREKVERERKAKFWKQQQEQREKWEREAAEALRKQQAEKRAAEQNDRKKRPESGRILSITKPENTGNNTHISNDPREALARLIH